MACSINNVGGQQLLYCVISFLSQLRYIFIYFLHHRKCNSPDFQCKALGYLAKACQFNLQTIPKCLFVATQ